MTGANACLCAGVFPPERGLPRGSERPGRPQQADGERGEGFLRGASPAPEAAQGRRDGQTGPAGHAGLGPGRPGLYFQTKRLLLTSLYLLFQVGYLAGSNGQPLLSQYLSDLDSALIPVIHGGACQLSEGPVVMELIFYILEIIS